ncbi:type IV fimbrial biogenesis protein FimT [Luteibacter sp. OK325]|jgi:type IV fimbrial biogenesis protein FimT|uniref:GspH/FimT family pseudopilin n=1 Tax=Luteibacter sp. OK325 TaxID=2135670 RepID=UPI000D3AC373|nr:GspH/FimT family pseudopilin [Luteibacter sp. OK325]PTR25464.1 type IV fimbrial biogenesis protein FimT [Luteibacter sp. OK325]
MNASRRTAGFSLIELMVAIGVFAILTALAVPSLSDFMKRNMVSNQTNDFLGAIRFARSTAVTRSTIVSICPSTTSSTTTPLCAATNTFNTGWLIYTSTKAGEAYKPTDELLRVAQNVPGASIQGATTVPVVTFDARGSSTYGTLSFFICSKAADDTVGQSALRYSGRRIDLQSGGRAGATPLQTSSSKTTGQGYCTAT